MCKSCDKTCPICDEQTWETHTNLCRSCYLATERIIKLLEDKRDRCGCYQVGMLMCRHTPTVNETIELIKGEQK